MSEIEQMAMSVKAPAAAPETSLFAGPDHLLEGGPLATAGDVMTIAARCKAVLVAREAMPAVDAGRRRTAMSEELAGQEQRREGVG